MLLELSDEFCDEWFDDYEIKVEKKNAKPRRTKRVLNKHLQSYSDPTKNIYSDILNKSLATLKSEHKDQNDFEKSFNLDFPVQKKTNKRDRLKQTAYHNSRKRTDGNEDNRISQRLTSIFPSEKCMIIPRMNIVRKKEELFKLRDSCVSWVAIEARLREIKALSDSLKAEEAYIDNKLSNITTRQEFHYKVIAREIQDTNYITRKFELRSKERCYLQTMCKSLSNLYCQLNVECVKAEEHFRLLMNHREFLLRVSHDEKIRESHFPQVENTLSTDFSDGITSDPNQHFRALNISKMKSRISSAAKESPSPNQVDDNVENKDPLQNKNESNINECDESMKSLQLLLDEYEERFGETLNELPFKSPEHLINIYEDNEFRNLNIIENLHFEEAVQEKAKHNISLNKKEHDKELNAVTNKKFSGLRKEENLMKRYEFFNDQYKILDQHLDVKPFAKIFKFGKYVNLGNVENVLEAFFEFIQPIFLLTMEDDCLSIKTTPKDLLFMLKTIESKIDIYFITLKSADRQIYLRAKSDSKLMKRSEDLERRKIEAKENMLKRLEKTLKKIKQRPKLTFGRKLMIRSKPPKLKRIEHRISETVKRKEEEIKYFFHRETESEDKLESR